MNVCIYVFSRRIMNGIIALTECCNCLNIAVGLILFLVVVYVFVFFPSFAHTYFIIGM
jgi:hypothetical protein